MTLGIEAGASQSQFSMKSLLGARFFRRPALERQAIHDRCKIWRGRGRSRRNQFVFQRDTIPKPSA